MLVLFLLILLYIIGFVSLCFLFGKYNSEGISEYIVGIIFWPVVLAGIIVFIPLELAFIIGYIAYIYGIYSEFKVDTSFKNYLKERFKKDFS